VAIVKDIVCIQRTITRSVCFTLFITRDVLAVLKVC
jgi:hypothetical protein